MRITGGDLRGRVFDAPEGVTTRPTTDRVRAALFNILLHHAWSSALHDPLDGAVVLDAFAGTGALGIEALSHGAASSTFFEKDSNALKVIRKNLAILKLDERATLVRTDSTRPPPNTGKAANLVFFDPPYRQKLIEPALPALETSGWIAKTALLVCETDKKEALNLPSPYILELSRPYGDTMLHFFVREEG